MKVSLWAEIRRLHEIEKLSALFNRAIPALLGHQALGERLMRAGQLRVELDGALKVLNGAGYAATLARGETQIEAALGDKCRG